MVFPKFPKIARNLRNHRFQVPAFFKPPHLRVEHKWVPDPPICAGDKIGGSMAPTLAPHVPPRAGGVRNGSGVRIRWLRKILGDFRNFGKTAKRSHFRPQRPPKSDSRPRFYTERTENQLIWSILERFRVDFLPNQAKSEPSNLGDPGGEPGFGFLLFFQWRTLDFQGSKKAPETSFLDS